jgi:hypothetical protein
MADQLLTVRFRVPKTTRWQQAALEKFGNIYAQTVVNLCRWAQDGFDFNEMSDPIDTYRIAKLLPSCEEVYADSRLLHSSLKASLVLDAASKIAAYAKLCKLYKEGKLKYRPKFWATGRRVPSKSYEELLDDAKYKIFETNREFLEWQSDLMTYYRPSQEKRPPLGECLFFAGASGQRFCHIIAKRHNGELQAAAVLFIAAKNTLPGLTIGRSDGWIDLTTGKPYYISTKTAIMLPLLVRTEYIKNFIGMALEGKARPAASKLFRRRRHEKEKWTWYVSTTFRVNCPKPYETSTYIEVEAQYKEDKAPSVIVKLPDKEIEVFSNVYDNHLNAVTQQQHERIRQYQKKFRFRNVTGIHKEGAVWKMHLHMAANSIIDIARTNNYGITWVGGAPHRLKRLPHFIMQKARLSGVPTKWVKKMKKSGTEQHEEKT